MVSPVVVRYLAAAGMAGLAVAGLALAWRRPAGEPRDPRRWALLTLAAALLVRFAFSLVNDGGLYDVFVSYRGVGDQLRRGGDVFVEPYIGLSNYPPVIYWWWAAASAVPADHPHLFAAVVRAPFWIVDSLIAPVLVLLRRDRVGVQAGLVYALSPVAVAVPTLHGQFDPLTALLLLLAVVAVPRRPAAGGLLAGLGAAIKPWPFYFAVPLLAGLRPRSLAVAAAGLLGVSAVAFGLYGLIHPQHVADGVRGVALYHAHRQGFGTGFLVAGWSGASLVVIDVVVGLLGAVAGYVLLRRGRSRAEAMAANILVLTTLAPTVSDQYLAWSLPFLLLAGRTRLAAILGAGLAPAVATLGIWTSQNLAPTPAPFFALATAASAAVLVGLIAVSPEAGPERSSRSDAPAATPPHPGRDPRPPGRRGGDPPGAAA